MRTSQSLLAVSLLLAAFAATPALTYTYYDPQTLGTVNPDSNDDVQQTEPTGASMFFTTTLSPEQVEEIVEEVMEQQQETADQYLNGLLNQLGSYVNSGTVQVPTREQQEQAQEQAAEAGEQLQEVVDTLVDAIYGQQDNDDENDNTTTAPITTTTADDDDDDEEDDETTVASVSTTTTPETYYANEDDDDEDDDETTTVAATTPATTESVQSVDSDETTAATYYYTTAPVVDDDEDDDDDDVTTTVPTVTRTLAPEDSSEDDTTTTTAATTTTTTHASTPAVPNMCDGCDFVHGVGYNPHPSDCTLFVQCRLSSDGHPVVAGVQACPHGLYWNQKKLSCDYRTNVQCVDDICRGYAYKKTKRSGASCRGYWDCSSGTAIAKCCAKGYAYNPVTHRCHYQPGCVESCLSSYTPTSFECPNGMRAVPGDKTKYEVKTGPNTWTRMPCPPTLGFSVGPPCGCNVPLHDDQEQECRPELYLPFTDNDKDQSGRQIEVKNEGVIVQDGKAFFNGESRLIVNRFSNTWFGRTVYVQVRYKALARAARHALVSNGDCQVAPSLAVCVGPDGVDFYGETQNSALPANFTVPFGYHDGEGWQDVLYRLDDDTLTGYVNAEWNSEPAKGVLQSRKRGLIIGSGGGCEDFTGFIDEVIVFLCRPDYKK